MFYAPVQSISLNISKQLFSDGGGKCLKFRNCKQTLILLITLIVSLFLYSGITNSCWTQTETMPSPNLFCKHSGENRKMKG